MQRRVSSKCLAWAWNATMRLASTQNVPAGHHASDLTSPACNIGLNRLRDITLRQDIKVFFGGSQVPLASVFKNKQSIVVGLPDLSSNQQAHASGYVADASKLRSSGYEQILVSAVASPEEMEAFITAIGAQPDGSIAGLADSSGHFCRMLGLDLNSPATEAPFSQRFLGMVNDGMLTKLCVEKAPELTEVSSSAAAVRTVQAMSFAE